MNKRAFNTSKQTVILAWKPGDENLCGEFDLSDIFDGDSFSKALVKVVAQLSVLAFWLVEKSENITSVVTTTWE